VFRRGWLEALKQQPGRSKVFPLSRIVLSRSLSVPTRWPQAGHGSAEKRDRELRWYPLLRGRLALWITTYLQ